MEIYVATYYKALSRHFSGRTEQCHANLGQNSWYPEQDESAARSKYQLEILPLLATCSVMLQIISPYC